MRRFSKVVVGAAGGVALVACTLTTDLDNFSGGRGAVSAPDAQTIGDADAETPDSSVSEVLDATADRSTITDASGAEFTDDFERPEADALGNEWMEKTPAIFSLAGGAAKRSDTIKDYRDNLVLRPESEDRRDVEVTVEIRGDTGGSPQALARVERSTAFVPDRFRGYLLYMFGSELTLGRQLFGPDFPPTLAAKAAALKAGADYRLRLSTRGAAPVVIVGLLEVREGATWREVARVDFTDTSPDRIDSGGAVGFGAGANAFVPVFESFSWRELPPQ